MKRKRGRKRRDATPPMSDSLEDAKPGAGSGKHQVVPELQSALEAQSVCVSPCVDQWSIESSQAQEEEVRHV